MNWKLLGQMIAAPVLGALFVLFLPVIGFVMLGYACYLKFKTLVWQRG